MKIMRQFRRASSGDLKVAYNEEVPKGPVFIGRVSCEKKTLEQIFGHIPKCFIMEIEEVEIVEGTTTDLW